MTRLLNFSKWSILSALALCIGYYAGRMAADHFIAGWGAL